MLNEWPTWLRFQENNNKCFSCMIAKREFKSARWTFFFFFYRRWEMSEDNVCRFRYLKLDLAGRNSSKIRTLVRVSININIWDFFFVFSTEKDDHFVYAAIWYVERGNIKIKWIPSAGELGFFRNIPSILSEQGNYLFFWVFQKIRLNWY